MERGDQLDVVYVVGEDGGHEELRYSLRSLANVSHGTVWVVGHLPKWATDVGHIPTVQGPDRYANSTNNLLAACDHPDVSFRFSLWNDDFFALRPTGIPAWHRGPIPAHMRSQPTTRVYQRGLAATADLLERWGHPEPLSYELHVPMWVDKHAMACIVRAALPAGIEALHKRSLYGNVARIGGTRVEDVKIAALDRTWRPGARWVSTDDDSFARGQVGADLRALFPAPSPYEVT